MAAIVFPIPSRKYVEKNGDRCPYCSSKQTQALGPVDVGNNGIGYQHIACQTCHATWYDQYKLVGFVPSKKRKKI